MKSDGFLITRDRQPLRLLSWTGAAMQFLDTSGQFLKEQGKDIVGQWSPVCFPFHGYVERPLSDFDSSDLKRIKGMLQEFRQCCAPCLSDRIDELEQLFKCYLEYPPYSLYDDWRGMSYERGQWAKHIFKYEPKFRL